MRYGHITEATRPFTAKLIDPALLTFREYYQLTNKENKTHPNNAYDWSLADMQRDYNNYASFPILQNHLTIAGMPFEIRLRKDDRWEGQYVRVDSDGEIVRDEHNQATYFTPEEVRQRIGEAKRYNYSVGIFNQQKQLVAVAQDEWGAWLFVVAQEYRGFGLGVIVGKLARSLHPDRGSGGFTKSGAHNLRRIHQAFVRDYLASGMYSWLVRSGQLTVERARAIIDSIGSKADVDWRPKAPPDLGSDDASNWLLYVGEYGDFMLYDKKLRDIDEAKYEHFSDQMIKGLAYVQVHDGREVWAMLRAFGGDTPAIQRLLMNCAIEYCIREDATLYLEEK